MQCRDILSSRQSAALQNVPLTQNAVIHLPARRTSQTDYKFPKRHKFSPAYVHLDANNYDYG